MERTRVRAGVALACAALLLGSPGCRNSLGSPDVRTDCSILLITIDTLRADHLGCYGYALAATPAMDGMAASGVRFAHTYAHNPVTLPSHANILSGLYPITHGVHDNSGFRFPGSTDTLATLLKARGFACGAFIGAFPLDPRFGLDRGFDIYDHSYGDATRARDFRFVERRAEDVVAPFLAWLDKLGNGRRWFAWVHLYDPHSPYDPPEPFKTRFAGRPYDGEIAYVDTQIGRVMEHLRERGLRNSTYVFLTADHGESLGDHNEPTHGVFAYDSTLHVPLIVVGPGLVQRVIRTRVRHIDLVPTALEVAGVGLPGTLSGRSLRALLNGNGDLQPSDSYFESMSANLNRNWAPLTGIISGNYKYIELPLAELYDLEKDPAEEKNLAAVRPEVVTTLRNRLDGFRKLTRPSDRVVEDPETIERLRSLGYVAGAGLGTGRPRTYTAEDDPKNLIHLDALLDEGVAAAGSGELERARSIFEGIIQKRPSMTIAYGHLAFVYSQMGMPARAVEVLEKAVKAGLSTPELMARLGSYLDEAGQSERAVAILEKAVLETQDNVDPLTYLGMAYTHTGQTDKAISTFQRILQTDSGNASAYANMGTVYLGVRDYPRALQVLEKALQLDPKLASAHNSMGVAMASTGNMEAAILSWRTAVQLDPTQYDTIYNLAILYLKLGRGNEARPYIDMFVRTAPSARYAADIEEFRRLLR